jgi:DMSO/TMAO reductase YedYZ molybdopterin-dependent catalytic subunit
VKPRTGGTAPAVALYFKSLGHEDWFYYYLSGMIFLSLIIYATMRDTKHDSAMHRHEELNTMIDEHDPPPDSKLTRRKQHWAREGRFLTGKTSRPEEQRLPPGQHLTRDWPTLDLGLTPNISRERWRLDVYGAVEHPIFWDFAQFTAQPQTQFTSDIHCVTTWSRYDNQFEGLATRDLLMACQPRDEARFVVLHSHDGYTTNLALEDFAAEDALLAHSWSGNPLEQEHGGPVRLVVPHLYFWKSAKWLQSIEFLAEDAPGYWEVRGYHNRGDPWLEQRYSSD